jgi:GTP-binding protein Era
MEIKKMKSGIVSIAGFPNVGKSTLLNSLLDRKLAITSEKPQTTRFQIRGVLTEEDSQIVFVDTPGIHKTKNQLGRFMINEIVSSFSNIDAVLLVVDAGYLLKCRNLVAQFTEYLDFLGKTEAPVILVLNKIDKIKNEDILKLIDDISSNFEFKDIVPVSAKKGYNIETLKNVVRTYLKSDIPFYPEDTVTNISEYIYASEIVREKILCLTRQEIPHSITCKTIKINKTKSRKYYLNILIIVERNSQKSIIIGKRGQMLKKIGEMSRVDLEDYFDHKVFLDLKVVLEENWTSSAAKLQKIGLSETDV